MSGQDDGALFVALRDFLDNGPHEAASLWIHSGGWFVQENDWRVANDGHANRKLTFVAAREGTSRLRPLIRQIEILDSVFDDFLSSVHGDTLDLSVEPKMLLDGQ